MFELSRSWLDYCECTARQDISVGLISFISFVIRLCPALKNIFVNGMRRPSILGGSCHPWLFIEEVSRTNTDWNKKDNIENRHQGKAFD